MANHIPLRLLLFTAAAAFILPAITVAQSQDAQAQSVVEAARRAREKKKTEKPVPVVTDDTLKHSEGATPEVSVLGESPSAPSSEAGTEQPSATAPAPDKKSEEAQKTEIDAAKAKLDEAKKDLDLAQREAALLQQTYYSNPNHQSDDAGKAKLDAMQQDIANKQQEVDRLKAELEDLQKSAGAAANSSDTSESAPVAPATSPTQPQR